MIKKIAVITGAANGIGKEYAKQVADKFNYDEIWIIDYDKLSLDKVKQEIPKSVPICLNLTKREDIRSLREMYENEDVNVVLFINNAGIGKMGLFSQVSKEDNLNMIDLNISALTELTYDVIPYMREGSTLVQVSSIVSFIPMRHYPVYGATKAYISYFSNVLSAQLKDKQIHVQLLCPLATRTKFFINASDKKFSMDPSLPNMFIMTPEKVVSQSIHDIRKNRFLSAPNWFWRFIATYFRFLSYVLLSPSRMMLRFWNSPQN